MTTNHSHSQHGVILIIVLWFIMIITILVITLANETRLSAKAVLANKQELQNWSNILTALRMAQMELFINKMPDPPGKETEIPLAERRIKAYRFNGQVLKCAYPVPKNITIRIFDHLGKLNIQRLTKAQMQDLLAKQIGDDPEELGKLDDAWQDWIDRDDLKRANGAEKEFYEKSSPPYEPRNGMLETVEEILLINGFEKIFKDFNLDAIFTAYNSSSGINPNFASREALMLIPGLDESMINTILVRRRDQDFKSFQDLNDFVEPEQMAKIRPWLNFIPGGMVYTIAIQTDSTHSEDDANNPNQTNQTTGDETDQNDAAPPTPEESPKTPQHAYMVTVQFQGFNRPPKTLMVNPYGILPDLSYESLPAEVGESKQKVSPSSTDNRTPTTPPDTNEPPAEENPGLPFQ